MELAWTMWDGWAHKQRTYRLHNQHVLKQAFISNCLKVYNVPLSVSEKEGQTKKGKAEKQAWGTKTETGVAK